MDSEGAEHATVVPTSNAEHQELQLTEAASPPETLIEPLPAISKEHQGLIFLAAQSVSKANVRAHAEWSWLIYEGVLGVSQDRKKAFELAQQGHDFGCAHCTGALARCYFEGYERSSIGCIDIENPLVELSEGTILLKDECRALLLARLSSNTGSSFGQYVEGLCYHQGKGFPEDESREKASDYARALSLWTLAANQGLGDAQFGLAGMYSNGFGVEAPDQERAFTLFKMAATQGNKVAQFMVGMFCQRGIGTAVDLSEARIWCELSAAQGLESAMQFLQSLTE
jgi:TPR repeat protein